MKDFWAKFGNKEMLQQFFDTLPYWVHILNSDGTTAFANKALCEGMCIKDIELGYNHNHLKNPLIFNELGIGSIFKLFNGETEILTLANIKTPLQSASIEPYTKGTNPESIKMRDGVGFPIYDEENNLAYVCLVSHTVQAYNNKRHEIMVVQEHMNKNWMEEFNMDKLASVSGLSKFHFVRLFKQHIGRTPFEYYKQIKIQKIKEKLLDADLSIKESFQECGVAYDKQYQGLFKKIVGMPPKQYRIKMLKSS